MDNTKISSVVAKKLLEVKKSFRTKAAQSGARKRRADAKARAEAAKREAEHRGIDTRTKSVDAMLAAHEEGDADYR